MRRLTFWLVWILVFSIPFDQIKSFAAMGSITRLLGLAATGSAVLLCVARGQVQKPNRVLAMAVVFAAQSILSLAWTWSYDASIQRCLTYVQLVGFIWLVIEFTRTQEEHHQLIGAYCLGVYGAIGFLLMNFLGGRHFDLASTERRYSAIGLDPNDLGLTIAIGIPLAWYLYVNRRGGFWAFVGLCYVPLAAIAIFLTGSRGAFLSGLVASTVIPLTSLDSSRRSFIAFILVLVTAVGVVMVVPQSSFDRINTVGTEVQDRNLDGRVSIWLSGLQVFADHPLLGVGSGAFPSAVASILGHPDSPHNAFISILVEQGTIGFSLFAILIVAWISLVLKFPWLDRQVWLVTITTWATGSMSLNWEYRKNTWLLFALVAAHASLKQAQRNSRVPSVAGKNAANASKTRDQSPLRTPAEVL